MLNEKWRSFTVTTIYDTPKQILRAKRAVYNVKEMHRVTVGISTAVCLQNAYKTQEAFQLISNNMGNKTTERGAGGEEAAMGLILLRKWQGRNSFKM